MIILFLTGIISGIISGMGIGGGTILIPILTLVLGFEQKVAQTVNLIYFIPTAIMALSIHLKNGNIEKGILKNIIFIGIVSAILGSILANYIDSKFLRKLFGWFLLFMGIIELFKKSKNKENENGQN